MSINNLYIGIPDNLRNSIFWVNRDYRLNDLSFNYGGTDIIVEYSDEKTYGYDWVKYPSNYIRRIFKDDDLIDDQNELSSLKQRVKSIYACVFDKNDKSKKFEEIWNSDYNELPYDKLKLFTYKLYENYVNFFLAEIDFAIQYISLYFPLKYDFIINNWEIIEKGDSYYSVYIADEELCYTPKFGLSFNKNIRWNSKLRAKYEYGFNNPYMGYIEGTGKENVEYDERDYLDTILPLDLKEDLSFRSMMQIKSMSNDIDSDDFELIIDKFDKKISFLDLSDFKKLYQKSKFTILVNQNIWLNTLSKIIDEDFVELIFVKANNYKKSKKK